MPKFTIECIATEVVRRADVFEADTLDDAIAKARDQYANESWEPYDMDVIELEFEEGEPPRAFKTAVQLAEEVAALVKPQEGG
jgi:hypothetical protein